MVLTVVHLIGFPRILPADLTYHSFLDLSPAYLVVCYNDLVTLH